MFRPAHPKHPPLAAAARSARAFNTGLFAARNTAGARAVLRAWAGVLTDPAKERADDPEHREVDDQLALNDMLEAGGRTPMHRALMLPVVAPLRWAGLRG